MENFSMLKHKYLPQIVSAAAVAILFSTSPLYAQTAGTGSNTTSSSGGTTGATSSGKISKADQEMMEDIAHVNLAEIETGKLALDKSQNPEVKKFAQMMIDDHTTAMKELQTLAQSKGVNLPTETDIQHKTIATALKALSGNTFDNQYIARVGVGDHQRTHDLLQKTQKNAKDPDLKAYAQKTIQVVDHHLSMAKKMDNKK
jgi:putative membrane protein